MTKIDEGCDFGVVHEGNACKIFEKWKFIPEAQI